MDEIEIKQEIKQEIKEEIFYDTLENEVDYDEVLDVMKFENDPIDSDEYEESSEYQPIHQSSHSNRASQRALNARNAITQPININCEKVYVQGEPEIYLPSPNQNNLRESSSDPLALYNTAPEPTTITTTISNPQPIAVHNTQLPFANSRRKFKKVRVVAARHVPPVKDLVQKTYSKKHKELPHVCTTCKKIYPSAPQLRDHERNCFKCKECNLIYGSIVHLANHMKRCRRRKGGEKNQLTKSQNRNPYVKSKSCNICSSTFLTDEEFEEHRKRNHIIPNAYACHLCDSKFDSEHEAHLHVNSH